MNFPLNPVVARELRARARRRGVPIVVSLFLIFVLGIAATVWAGSQRDLHRAISSGNGGLFQLERLTKVGRQMFEWTLLSLFALLSFMVPGFTAGSITGERDRQTLIPMQVTLLRPRQIIFGKMLSSSSFTLFLLIMAVPIVALGYAVGGVDLLEVIRAVVGLFVIASIWACISVFASAVLKRTAPAIVFAYALMLVFLVGTLIVAGVSQNKALTAFNPYVMFSDFVTPSGGRTRFLSSLGPISAAASGFVHESFPYWLRGLLFFVLVSGFCLWVAVKRVTTPATTDR